MAKRGNGITISTIMLLLPPLQLLMMIPHVESKLCPRGSFHLEIHQQPAEWEECLFCQDGETYMDEDNHQHTSCFNCTMIKNVTVENRISHCNITHDTEIVCAKGYFRQDSECRACTEIVDSAREQLLENCTENQDMQYSCYYGYYKSGGDPKCIPCLRIKETLNATSEIMISECTETDNALIQCKTGYFYNEWAEDSSLVCQACTPCSQYTIQSCGGSHDTVCCPTATSLLAWDPSHRNYFCEPACTAGHYYKDVKNCYPCPNDTYMNEPIHNKTVCHPCPKIHHPGRMNILLTCNSTHPSLIICKPGYFKTDDGYCVPCRSCKFYNRACSPELNAICCSMTTLYGYKCLNKYCPKQDCGDCAPGYHKLTRFISHNYTNCHRCAELQNQTQYNSRIIKNCSIRSPTHFGCLKGYHRLNNDTIREKMCTKCTECPRGCRILYECNDYADVSCFCPNNEKIEYIDVDDDDHDPNGGSIITLSYVLFLMMMFKMMFKMGVF